MNLKLKIGGQKRKGFTLLEVLYASIALAIVSTILFSLSASAHLTTLRITKKTIAQNIAQATLEDIKAQANANLETLIVSTTSTFANYPVNGTGISGGSPAGTYHVKTNSQILLAGITNFFPGKTEEEGIALEAVSASNIFTKTDTNWNISLFNYINDPFSREITIKKMGTSPESYGIDIIIKWKLNSTTENQSLAITGLKN